MTSQDLEDVVRLHQLAFRGFFLDSMGPQFLAEYYKTVLAYENSIAIAAVSDQGVIVGFAVGFLDPASFYKFLRKRRLALSPLLVLSILKRPSLLAAVWKNVKRVNNGPVSSFNTVELSSIASAKSAEGIGSVLLKEFQTIARHKGGTDIELTTDEHDNDAVKSFYGKHGFKVVGHENRGERILCKYRLEII
jgi:ribosomal protein S18 acetylase RimI-like enzyme